MKEITMKRGYNKNVQVDNADCRTFFFIRSIVRKTGYSFLNSFGGRNVDEKEKNKRRKGHRAVQSIVTFALEAVHNAW